MPVTSSQWLHTRKFPQWNSEIWQSPAANRLAENSCGSQDWDEMQMSLFGSSITLSEYTAADLFWFWALLSTNTFSHPQESFPWSSIYSLKGILFLCHQKVVHWHFGTNRTKRCKRQYMETAIIVKLLHTFLICREGNYCWQNQNIW